MVKNIYLAGAVQAAPDKGAGWRREITPQLEAIGLRVRDPCIEIDGYLFKKHNFDGNWKKLLQETDGLQKTTILAREIVEADLRVVERCEIILCYFDEYVPKGAGTYGELTVAANQKIHGAGYKEIYIVLTPNMQATNIPVWILGCVDAIFPNFNECIQYLQDKGAW